MNTINNIFNTNRFWYLLKREVLLNYKAFGLVSAITLMFYTLGTALPHFFSNSNSNGFNSENLIVSLSFMLIIWASISFNELATTPGRQHYLSIPASSFEKLGTKWVVISILLPLGYMVVFFISSFVITWLINLIGAKQLPNPSFDNKDIFTSLVSLIGLQALFYAGSVTWPKYSLFKTLFFGFASSIVIMLISYFFAAIIFHEHFNNGSLSFNENNFNINIDFLDNIPMVSRIIGFIGSVVFMTIAYFKLKEKEL